MLNGLFFLEKSMNHKHIIKSLPLLASVLGRKYGVQVRIGGDNAFTNGNVIQLPSLSLDCNETLLGLVRGLIDHESAHIRDTDFDALKAANLTPLEKHIWNTIEDWRLKMFSPQFIRAAARTSNGSSSTSSSRNPGSASVGNTHLIRPCSSWNGCSLPCAPGMSRN